MIDTSQLKETMGLHTESWGHFLLKDICKITMGNKLNYSEMSADNPTVNFVGRSAMNNGVAGKVDIINDIIPYKAGSITVALGGSLGSSYIQQEDFYTSQNVAVLEFDENISTLSKLFLCQIIQNECKYKYVAFGRELNVHIRKDFDMYLPQTELGEPDWQFMEEFMGGVARKAFDNFCAVFSHSFEH